MGLLGNSNNKEDEIIKILEEKIGRENSLGGYKSTKPFKAKLAKKNLGIPEGRKIYNQLKNELLNGELEIEDIENRADEIIEKMYEEQQEYIKKTQEKMDAEMGYERPPSLFDIENNPTGSIMSSITRDLDNLGRHTAGSKWMQVGTLLSMNSTEQMIGAGFRGVIDQNNALIKQNELLRRQNQEIMEQNKKIIELLSNK